MYKILLPLVLVSLNIHFQRKDEVKILLNSTGEERKFAYLNDTALIKFIPANEHTSSTYLLHNVTITFEGLTGAKEKLIQPPVSIAGIAPSKNPVIGIPLKKYIKNGIDYGIKVYIDIEAIEKREGGKTEVINIPKSQLHREFTCTK